MLTSMHKFWKTKRSVHKCLFKNGVLPCQGNQYSWTLNVLLKSFLKRHCIFSECSTAKFSPVVKELGPTPGTRYSPRLSADSSFFSEDASFRDLKCQYIRMWLFYSCRHIFLCVSFHNLINVLEENELVKKSEKFSFVLNCFVLNKQHVSRVGWESTFFKCYLFEVRRFEIHGNLLPSYLAVLWIFFLKKCLCVVPENNISPKNAISINF